LTAAKLTRAVLLAADLSNARLTGATTGHWNIDKFTRFDGIVCESVYLDEACKERHPATGQFRHGEFAKLYQEIAHTVDFLIENSAQMEALLRTLEKLRASYDDADIAQVQKVERKGEAYKVSVEVPAEMEDILRKELREEYDQRLQSLEQEHQHQAKLLQKDVQHLQQVNAMLSSQRDDQKQLLDRAFDALNRPTAIHNILEAHAMNDHSRSINNASIANSAVNLGDHAEVSNSAQIGLPSSEIGTLLGQLRGLIHQSAELPEVLKLDALEKIETLNKAAAKPKAEAQSAAAGALEALNTTAKLATGISGVVAALSQWFGF
jgi:chromosome segregation ATPase